MASSSSGPTAVTAPDLEDFADIGVASRMEALSRDPAFPRLRERIRDEAYARGRADAMAEADAARERMVRDEIERVEALLAELAAARAEMMRRSEEELLQLAVALARRVIRVQVATDEGLLLGKLVDCLGQVERSASYHIRVNPGQYAALEALLEHVQADIFAGSPFRILPDERVTRGGLIIEGDRTRLESICEEELERLEEELFRLHREQEADDGL
ncbi:MAG: hypothetical protein JW819_01085 [Candidatus Krumholzibacteriota bacterium]|nr:hypothetical protein [Candidatus Krumholzibacteriota bacterium]